MPVIKVSIPRLLRLVGEELDLDELRRLLFRIKCESEAVEDGRLEVEVTGDRPDMFSPEGIARVLRGIMKKEKGFRIPETYNSEFVVYVDPPLRRPYIAVGLVENVELDEIGLEELIQFQEKLHVTYGRNRRKIAIGIHDLSKVPSKELRYIDAPIDNVRFVPLHHSEVMSIREVLRKTEQGILYGTISLNNDKHPAIFSGDTLISLPPVINADLTKLEPGVSSLLIDVTGTDHELVDRVLSLLVLNICENSENCHIGQVKVVYKSQERVEWTPSLPIDKISVKPNLINEVLGTQLNIHEIAEALSYMRFNVRVNGSNLAIEVPPFRFDILHPVDLAEDVAIFIGYDELGPEEVPSYGYRTPSLETRTERFIRDILISLGYQELNTFTLTSSNLLTALGYSTGEFLKMRNPLSLEFDALRPSLLPTLLDVMRMSQHAVLPVKVFEVSEVVVPDKSTPTGWRTVKLIGMGYMDSVLRFEELHADIYAFLRELGLSPRTSTCSNKIFIVGRSACVYNYDVRLGIFGEVKPEILEKLDIRNPVALAEIRFDNLVDAIRSVKAKVRCRK